VVQYPILFSRSAYFRHNIVVGCQGSPPYLQRETNS
jgi:hypothetical protein